MMSAPPPPSIVSLPEPVVIVFAPDDPVTDTAVASADASTLWKFVTLVESAVVWSTLARLTVAAALRTKVLAPAPPSIDTSVP